MNDDVLERDLRAWFDAQAEPEVPTSLRRYLLELPRSQQAIERVARRSPILAAAPRRDLALVLLAATAVLAVGAGLIAGFGPWKTISPSQSPLGSLQTKLPPSPGPSAPPVAGPYRWTLASSTGEVSTYSIESVIRRPDGTLLAIGFGQEARVLTSPDGRTWNVQPADPGLLRASTNHLSLVTGLAEDGGNLVAVGATALDDISSGDARAWTSTDGGHWQAVPTSSGMLDAEMESVTAGPGGFVAVGSDGFPGGNTQLPGARGAAVWTSPDGRIWTRAPSQPSFDGAVMFGVRRTSSGYVAWGELHDPAGGGPGSGPFLPPIWTSTDGLHWDRGTGIADAGGPGDPIASITPIGDRLVAVGSRQLPESGDGIVVPAAWLSDDGGRSWTLAKSPDAGSPPRAAFLRDVAVSGSDLLAVGLAEALPGASAAYASVTWRSTDEGATWVPLPDDPSFAGSLTENVIGTDGGFVVFGSAEDPSALANRYLIWFAEAPARTLNSAPIDASIVPVSASHPSSDAAAALEACGFLTPGGNGIGYSLGIVSGMGLVSPGRNANFYAPIGNTPEVKTDAPLWVITTSGRVDLVLAGTLIDGTCIVAPGSTNPLWLATGPFVSDNGVSSTPMPQPPAVRRLPPLAP
jgi:hypothetical protein